MPPTWTNWAGEQRCAPVAIERPTSEPALAELVRRSAQRGLTVRAVGSGHSFTDCACTEGVMVDMTGLQQILDIDSASGRVTVEAGAKLHGLGPVLAEHGLALENQGDIDRQSISGAISTATHGTGAKLQNIAARVVGLRLVTASGEVIEVGAEHDEDT
jgi:L-gulonolactone oxidase